MELQNKAWFTTQDPKQQQFLPAPDWWRRRQLIARFSPGCTAALENEDTLNKIYTMGVRVVVLFLFCHLSQGTSEQKNKTANLAESLILASSPFGSSLAWRPTSLARRINLSEREGEGVESSENGPADNSDSDPQQSKIHEVRVDPPFPVTHSVDRNGKSLYSPGPAADRWMGDWLIWLNIWKKTLS